MPAISVITPICNVEKYLAQCLDSLCAQTLQDIEFICIDDGSTDSSSDILRKYEACDSRIKAIYKTNSGYGATMNLGLKHATGDYISIVESDDFVAPDAFEQLLSFVRENDEPDVVKSNFYEFSEDKGEVFQENYSESHHHEKQDGRFHEHREGQRIKELSNLLSIALALPTKTTNWR